MKRVLVVDDDMEIRVMLRRMLGHLGYDIVEADDSAKAVVECKRQKIDLVIMDILMKQGKGGIEGIIDISRDMPGTKILAISGGGHTGHPTQYLDLAAQVGADKVMPKPINVKKLIKEIVALIGEP